MDIEYKPILVAWNPNEVHLPRNEYETMLTNQIEFIIIIIFFLGNFSRKV